MSLQIGSAAIVGWVARGIDALQSRRDEINSLNQDKNHNLKRLCKMVRAWKNDHGVPMKGMLIDTLCYQFLKSTTDYDASPMRPIAR